MHISTATIALFALSVVNVSALPAPALLRPRSPVPVPALGKTIWQAYWEANEGEETKLGDCKAEYEEFIDELTEVVLAPGEENGDVFPDAQVFFDWKFDTEGVRTCTGNEALA
jgi:hypothetical protein